MSLAVVTGATRGVGNYIASKLLDNNYKVVNISRNSSNDFINYNFDLTNLNEISNLVKEIVKNEGVPKLLINNAGIASMNHTTLMKDEKVKQIINLNLISPIILTKNFSKFMLRKKSKILNISTVAVPLLLEGEAVYASSKSGIETFTKIFAKELKPFNLQISCIGLTPIETDLIKNVPKEKIQKIISSQPTKKVYSLEDVWKLVDEYIKSKDKTYNGEVRYLGGF